MKLSAGRRKISLRSRRKDIMAYKKIMAAAFAVTLFLAGCAGSTDKGTSQAAVPLKETMNPISVR